MNQLVAALQAVPVFGPVLPYIPVVIAVASLLSTVTPPPTPTSGVAYQTWYRLISVISLAFGHATNATDPKVKS